MRLVEKNAVSQESRSQRRMELATATLLSLLVPVIVVSYWRVQQDDAYIFYTYAENIVHGNGYVFNVDERINATTSPLYTLLLAGIYSLLRWLPIISIPLVGHLVGGVSLFVIVILSMKMLGNAGFRIAPYLFPVLFLASPLLIHGPGMETFPTLALVVAALYFYQQERLLWTSAFLALAVLARPDTAILPVVLLADHLTAKRAAPPVRAFVIFVLILVPWLVFSRLYFGGILPSTLSAKLGQTQSGRWGTGFLFLDGLMTSAFPRGGWLIGIALGISAFYLAVDREWARERIVRIVLLWSFLYLIAYGIVLNPPAYPWYYTPLAIGTSLVFALALEIGFRRKPIAGRVTRSTYVGVLCAVVGVGALVLPLDTLLRPVTPKYENYKLAAQWLNEHAFEGATVAANEIGVLGYFYERGKIIDALGLVTPGVAERVSRQDYAWYLHEYQPDFLMFDHPRREILEEMVDEPWFQQRYRRATTIGIGSRAVAIYEATSR